jgi:hypothetical protein
MLLELWAPHFCITVYPERYVKDILEVPFEKKVKR